jgi:hypothetical protein
MRTPSLKRLAGAAATALFLAGGLTACGSDADDAEDAASDALASASDIAESAEEDVSEAIESAESELGEVDTELPEDVPSDLGEAGLNELPEDFPGDIPLADADIVSAAAAPGTDGWAVVMETDAAAEDAFAQAESVLLDNGYDADSPAVANAGVYSNKNWTIALAVTEVTGSTTINYGITAK